MKKRGLLLGAGLAAGLNGTAVQSAGPDKPNIVLILMDDMGVSDVGCYGSTFYRTPNIDKLCSEGMKFTQAYAAAPICSPTRASILFGQYPARTHITDFIPGRAMPYAKMKCPVLREFMPNDTPSIASELKKAGYVSAIFGKWHVARNMKQHGPLSYGFDTYFEDGDLNSKSTPQDPKGVFALTGKAIDFMRENKDKPFFLFVSHYSVHDPLQCNPVLRDEYKTRIKPGAVQNNPIYATMIDDTDRSIGQLLVAMKELGLEKNTLVMFFSDNGGLLSNTSNEPFRNGKGSLYEGGIREPLIIRWPGRVEPGSVSDQIVSSVDLMPTFMDLAGVADRPPLLDGVSFVSVFTGKGKLNRDAIFWHYPHYYKPYNPPCGAVRAGQYKLIRFYDDNRTELYDLQNDLAEQNNLTSKMTEKTAELSAMLDRWKASVGAAEVTLNPAYDPARTNKMVKKKSATPEE